MRLFPPLQSLANELLQEQHLIPAQRIADLQNIAAYISRSAPPAKLNFICTHNSRRSHISQIWATTAAAYFKVDVQCFSGGTEATAFNPRAVAAMQRAGFEVNNPGGENPKYQVRYAEDGPAIKCFSKTFDAPSNPKKDFAAIMTCSDADANCPFIRGATRFSLTYNDPKEADDTAHETARYDERVRQIGRELFYALGRFAER